MNGKKKNKPQPNQAYDWCGQIYIPDSLQSPYPPLAGPTLHHLEGRSIMGNLSKRKSQRTGLGAATDMSRGYGSPTRLVVDAVRPCGQVLLQSLNTLL